MQINININDDLKGKRLDSVISDLIVTCSRKKAACLIDQGDILVNNYKKKSGYKLKKNDIVTGFVKDFFDSNSIIEPENIFLDIVFEDDHIIIINKKAGMVVYPAPGNFRSTLVNALLFHFPFIENTCSEKIRSGIVHRLDKNTSGLIVIAKTAQALSFLQKEFKYRRVQKKYLALVCGNLPCDQGIIDDPISRHPVKKEIMSVNYEKGKSALTFHRLKKRFKSACFVEVIIKTGRTHQIRVHFYNMGNPLLGDTVYQFKRYRKKNIVSRQMLHSCELSFRHPYSGEKLSFYSPLPKDFEEILLSLE